jgi:hypothetical protein
MVHRIEAKRPDSADTAEPLEVARPNAAGACWDPWTPGRRLTDIHLLGEWSVKPCCMGRFGVMASSRKSGFGGHG